MEPIAIELRIDINDNITLDLLFQIFMLIRN